MTSQEFKSFEDYNPKDRPTLHYVFTYPECGISCSEMIDIIIEHMPTDILEWKVAIQHEFYYIIVKFHLGITVPFIKRGLIKAFGSENIDKFQYCKISSVKKADTLIDILSESIQSDSYLQTERRSCSSRALFDWSRERAQFLKHKEKLYTQTKTLFNQVNVDITSGQTLEGFLKHCEELFDRENPKPE